MHHNHSKAVEAATRLVIDPGQANWVKNHWGTNYLKTENVFYRMLVIAALTSHARLTSDRQYLPLLKDQVDSLASEIDTSPHGLLDDYPHQCYPGDVLTAIAMINRADKVLGSDHSTFVRRALRGFQGRALDAHGLVPYAASAREGTPLGPSRGCGNSYVSIFAGEIWPGPAREWYNLYCQHFWQETWGGAGFREFPRDMPGSKWYMDVDAGPVLQGFGCAASAFGVGATRVNGDFARAYPLTAQMLVTAWPLPTGTLLLPRLLSNAVDAPCLGEAAVLFNLTRLPMEGTSLKTGGSIPAFVWGVLVLQFGVGVTLIGLALRAIYRSRTQQQLSFFTAPRIQLVLSVILYVGALYYLFAGKEPNCLVLLLCAQLLPRAKRTLRSGEITSH